MADVLAVAEVRLWGTTVGAVAESRTGEVVFEYDPDFRARGLEISPVHLPLRLKGPVQFRELRRKEAFLGLPGVLADALPDAFGRAVTRAYHTARGRTDQALSPVQHLLYVGSRAIGALEFQPETDLPSRPDEEAALDLATLVADARRVIGGDAAVAIPEIYRIGSSAGGARPKAVVLFNPTTREIRSAFAAPAPDDVPCILKFDGVGDPASGGVLGAPQPFNRIEAAYSDMARAAGIDAVRIQVVEGPRGHAHLVMPRFDRVPDDGGFLRVHQHTLGGLLHVDYNEPGAVSYEEYLRTILLLGMPPRAVHEGFRRMVFNVLAVNQDDHVKNLSFHMDPQGRWSLTPAYDLTFAKGTGFTARHQMRVADRTSGIRHADLVQVARDFGIRDPAGTIAKVEAAVADWPRFASSRDVPDDAIRRVQNELETRRREVSATSSG